MKTNRTAPYTFGDKIHLTIPASWAELTQEQLHYVYFLRVNGYVDTQIQVSCFVRFTGIEVIGYDEPVGWHCEAADEHFYLTAWEVHHFIGLMEYLNTPPAYPVKLERIGGYTSVNAALHDITFEEYLTAENYYQTYIRTKDPARLVKLANILYRDENGLPAKLKTLSDIEEFAVLSWYHGIKQLFAGRFSDFFCAVDTDEENEKSDRAAVLEMECAMNAQIRALTGGDITKESAILLMDVWRALTELNEKAREAKEWERRMKR